VKGKQKHRIVFEDLWMGGRGKIQLGLLRDSMVRLLSHLNLLFMFHCIKSPITQLKRFGIKQYFPLMNLTFWSCLSPADVVAAWGRVLAVHMKMREREGKKKVQMWVGSREKSLLNNSIIQGNLIFIDPKCGVQLNVFYILINPRCAIFLPFENLKTSNAFSSSNLNGL
jgi:hypothetical protein